MDIYSIWSSPLCYISYQNIKKFAESASFVTKMQQEIKLVWNKMCFIKNPTMVKVMSPEMLFSTGLFKCYPTADLVTRQQKPGSHWAFSLLLDRFLMITLFIPVVLMHWPDSLPVMSFARDVKPNVIECIPLVFATFCTGKITDLFLWFPGSQDLREFSETFNYNFFWKLNPPVPITKTWDYHFQDWFIVAVIDFPYGICCSCDPGIVENIGIQQSPQGIQIPSFNICRYYICHTVNLKKHSLKNFFRLLWWWIKLFVLFQIKIWMYLQ